MSLVVTSEVEEQARAIIATNNAFDALGLTPLVTQREAVVQAYEERVQPFRRAFRNRLAMEAKSRLDTAKVRLLDEKLRALEVEKFNAKLRTTSKKREELNAIAARTKILENRAAAVLEL